MIMNFPQVNGYEITEKIGAGSYSTVYQAYKKPNQDDIYAIKCIDKQYHKKSFANNIVKEISLLKQLKHNNIVDMKDFLWNTKHIFIITEYCDGGDLSSLIRSRHKLKEPVVKKLMQQLAMALQFLRENNVCHMDLKPQNILLTWKPELTLKVADFGLSQHITGEIEHARFVGSPLYMAPEKLLHQKFDARVDLWSAGIIMFECLFGRPPYTTLNSHVLNLMSKQIPIELPKHVIISKECEDLLKCLLKHNPDERIDFEGFFNHPFLTVPILAQNAHEKAQDYIQEAIKFDQQEKFSESIPLYEKAVKIIEILEAAEADTEKKSLLKIRLKEYTSWIEVLKVRQKEKMDFIPQSFTLPKAEFECLYNAASATPTVASALDIGKIGELYLAEGKKVEALEKFKSALGILVPALQNEPKGPRRNLLHKQIQLWLRIAEMLNESN